MNWETLLQDQSDRSVFAGFVRGDLSGRQIYSRYVNTERGGQVRQLLRGGVNRARSLARRALQRRGVL